MKEHCSRQEGDSRKAMNNAITRGSTALGTFKEKYREQGSVTLMTGAMNMSGLTPFSSAFATLS